MKSFVLLLVAIVFVLLLFYELYSPTCPEPVYITVPPKIKIVYVPVTNAPKPPDPPAVPKEDPQQVVEEDWPKPESAKKPKEDERMPPPAKPPKPKSAEIPDSERLDELMPPDVIDKKNKEIREGDPAGDQKQPEIVIDNNVPKIDENAVLVARHPEPLPGNAHLKIEEISDLPENLRLFSKCLYIAMFKMVDVYANFEKANTYCVDALKINSSAIGRYVGIDDYKFFIDPNRINKELGEGPC
ncbi:hypothetical protein L596_023343 [Steinernema carpocapsae]|uniref:Uncharacterized protein n=1 Tax=Steinernema carpocapsae TaxID=34508 RepID=A0A4U5MDB9_STECR|nr:hypothetical protein L596_023343 [Steinernema carpocapsae]